jgi:hypothetical protein
MSECAVRLCEQQSVFTSDVCFYHDKLRAGLIDPHEKTQKETGTPHDAPDQKPRDVPGWVTRSSF